MPGKLVFIYFVLVVVVHGQSGRRLFSKQISIPNRLSIGNEIDCNVRVEKAVEHLLFAFERLVHSEKFTVVKTCLRDNGKCEKIGNRESYVSVSKDQSCEKRLIKGLDRVWVRVKNVSRCGKLYRKAENKAKV